MKYINPHTLFVLLSFSFLSAALNLNLDIRAADGYVQNPSGNASFTAYTGCITPACGKMAHGFTAAMDQLSFGAAGGEGSGDACGRCFRITATGDPYSPNFQGPFNTVVVKITDLCPGGVPEMWCGQSTAHPLNQVNMTVHFDLCGDSGAGAAFFPEERGALTGYYEEVSCNEWSGYDGPPLWNGGCLAGEDAPFWPDGTGCGNTGTAP